MTYAKKLSHPLLLSMLSGILVGTSTIPFPPWALFFCLAPLIHLLINEKPLKIFIYTSLTFFTLSLIGFYWVAHLLQKFAQFPPWLSYIVLIFFCLFYHMPIALGLAFIKRFFSLKNKPLEILTYCASLSLLWIVTPMLFPWNLSINWIYGNLWAYEFMDVFGAIGLHSITVFLSGACLWAFYAITQKKDFKPLGYLLIFLISFNGLGYLYSQRALSHQDQSLKVSVIQGNIGNMEEAYTKYGPRYKTTVLNTYLDLSAKELEKNPDTDFIIWPETAFPTLYEYNMSSNNYFLQKTKSFLEKYETQLITGIFSRDSQGQISNSALFYGEDMEKPLVHKEFLLAFGEYLPGEKWFPFLRSLLPMVGDFKRGPGPEMRTFKKANVGIVICYESLLPNFSRKLSLKGSQLLVNLTNDSWYGPHSEPLQHLYSLSARAVENRRPILRSTNTGISTLITPHGRPLNPSSTFERWSHTYTVDLPDPQKRTFYQRAGHFLTLPLLLIVFIFSVIYGKK